MDTEYIIYLIKHAKRVSIHFLDTFMLTNINDYLYFPCIHTGKPQKSFYFSVDSPLRPLAPPPTCRQFRTAANLEKKHKKVLFP